jgi:EAL domain-containing protein (putative c-di-GMP-specific phosphodiesterase class I)
MFKSYTVEEIKIDRVFTAGVSSNPVDQAVVASLVTLGQRLGLTVVAEGVESTDAASTLAALGCDRLQGFHFGRPVPAELTYESTVVVEVPAAQPA